MSGPLYPFGLAGIHFSVTVHAQPFSRRYLSERVTFPIEFPSFRVPAFSLEALRAEVAAFDVLVFAAHA
jgi:hypothetical protein